MESHRPVCYLEAVWTHWQYWEQETVRQQESKQTIASQGCQLLKIQDKNETCATVYHSKRWNTEIHLLQYNLQARGIFHSTLPREYTD